jgi:uncharacterized protein YwgA|tara:strand:- start:11979 stop:12338 length:360 start_codon:yes stop_codon:yes gene_type:complete
VYLLKKFGFDIGYDFQWYHYGPYSVSLNLDSFNIDKTDPVFVSLDENQKSALESLRFFLGPNSDSLRFLETAASLLFLKDKNPFCSNQELKLELLNLKKHLNFSDVDNVIIKLENSKIL